MTLEMKQTSRWWYGRFVLNGKSKLVNLGVEIKGSRPASIGQSGDDAFERSRGKAIGEHDRVLADLHSKHNIEELTQRVIHLKTGARIETVKLADLPDAWGKIPRRRKPSVTRAATARKTLQRFVAFLSEQHPEVKELYEVTQPMTRAFLQGEETRGVSPRTWNATASLLRSVFRYLQPEAEAYRRHLAITPGKQEDPIHRQPFTVEEVKAILEVVQDDDLMRPLVVTALCTAMRKGDCCLLKKKDVDWKNGFVAVKTSKTGEHVEIPMLPLLRRELTHLPESNSEYVFPFAAEEYKRNPDGLNTRLKQVLAKAGFVDGDLARKIQETPECLLPRLTESEVRRRSLAAIAGTAMTPKRRENMQKVFGLYMDGKNTGDICRELNVSKGTVSGHLHTVEKMIGAQVIRRSDTVAPPAVFRGSIHAAETVDRMKKISVRGWHSFRTTWITLALSAGLPMELVRRVSGHTTTDVVLKHYFKPGREDFRRAIQSAMPNLLSAGQPTNAKTPKDEAVEILRASCAAQWKRDCARVLALLEKM